MRTAGVFVARLLVYGIGVAIALLLARAEWAWLGLDALVGGGGDAAARIARWQERLPVAVAFATFVIAALGTASRLLGTFLIWALLALIVTAPFAIARASAM